MTGNLVVLVLIALVLVVGLVVWSVRRTGGFSADGQEAALSPEEYAILVAAISAESGMTPDKFRIESIREIK